MAYGIGANDVANAMGTSVGANILTLREAILIAAIFEFLGAFLAGGEVTQTISQGITHIAFFYDTPDLWIYGMMAALLSSALWLILASYCGWPVSTTHSIIGAIVGFSMVSMGPGAVYWQKVGFIFLSWIISPLLGGIVAYCIFMSIQRLIFLADNPFQSAKRYIPCYVFLMGTAISWITLCRGLSHIGIVLSTLDSVVMALGIGILAFIFSHLLLLRIQLHPLADKSSHFASVERVFGIMMIFTACSMAFAHGSNDVANAVGPLAAISSAIENNGVLSDSAPVSSWILLMGAIGIVVGLATYGYRVINTVGKHITELTPSRGFAAEISAALTVLCASGIGLPISSTHTLVGAILGVGFARGIGALNLRVLQKILLSWIITLPAGALLCIVVFYILRRLV